MVQTPEFGGAEKHLIDFVRRMDDAIHCVILCFSEDFYTRALEDRPNVRIEKLPLIRTNKFLSFWRVFLRHRNGVLVFVKGVFDHYPLSAYLAARLSGVKRVIVIEHLIADPVPPPQSGPPLVQVVKRLFGWRTRYLLARRVQSRLGHLTVCVSEAIRRRLVEEYGYPADRTLTIRNGIDLARYSPEADREGVSERCIRNDRTIVCAARLSSVKRIDLLLDALARLKELHSGWRCLILGTGPMRDDLLSQAHRLNLLEHVSFIGHVDDVRPFLKRADLFVLTSDKEGLPLALLEAMAMGIPPVVTDVGGTGEVVIDGDNGRIVQPGSVEAIERAIGYMLDHEGERKRMGQAAMLHMRRHFDIEQSMERLRQVVLSPCPQ
ncbi:hypothetical protein W02_12590 [Nitrospira sp. KM1]|uniref:glycosyltransferase n=1 Tax=Nitrospira sp. KM1 TaxID=1936990 RepID=UPI0013A7AF56|nr:glycosyltransferase [Nitrospira sp. KM1]BCA54119.1 hypothetical protein W02_12590 [Nitrospira sp. KM1]